MTARPRNVPAPPDALAWVWPDGRDTPHWATTDAQVSDAYRRGHRMLPTETDWDGRRWVRGVTEYTHLADHLALATTVHHLAYAIDRVRTELEEIEHADALPPDDSAEPSGEGETARITHTSRATLSDGDPVDAAQSPGPGPRPPTAPDPADALMALMRIFEHGTTSYRGTDSAMPGLHELWDRLDGDDKRLLATYEQAANRRAKRWADDRFRLGYALGASGILRDLYRH